MRIMVMAGTRPEVVKMAPVIRCLRKIPILETSICTSGQHKEMLAQAFRDFNMSPDYNLDVMIDKQGLCQLTANILKKIDPLFEEINPDWLLIQGDTTSAMVAALAAYYKNIKIGHVEAGLRSYNKYAPFPEEINRKIASLVADLHFAPTELAKNNLLREGINADRIFVTGNTVVDSLQDMLAIIRKTSNIIPPPILDQLEKGKKLIFVTAHRRENQGSPLLQICNAIKHLARVRKDIFFVYPVHLNPHVHDMVFSALQNRENIFLFNPFPYKTLVSVLDKTHIVLTDSGGLQEESTILHKPVLVLRDNTERMEGIKAGAARLVGTREDRLVYEIERLLDDNELDAKMRASTHSIYGDGHAAARISSILQQHMAKES